MDGRQPRRTWLSINSEGNWLLLIPPQPDRAHVNISSPDFKGRCHQILSSWLSCEFHVYSLLAFQFVGCISKKMDQKTPVDEGREANTRTLMTALFTTETNKWTKAKQLNSTHRENESISVYQRHRVLGRRWEESEGRGCQYAKTGGHVSRVCAQTHQAAMPFTQGLNRGPVNDTSVRMHTEQCPQESPLAVRSLSAGVPSEIVRQNPLARSYSEAGLCAEKSRRADPSSLPFCLLRGTHSSGPTRVEPAGVLGSGSSQS